MLEDNKLAYSEIDKILSLLEDKYKEKVPKKVRKFFSEEKDSEYIPKIDPDKPLIEQNLKKQTLSILALLNLSYWCEDEKEKQKFINQLKENEKEKYNVDNLFKNKEENSNIQLNKEKLEIIEYKKKNFIQRFLNKIIEFFKRK